MIKPIQPRTYSSKSQSLGLWYAFLTNPGMTRSVVQILVCIRRLYVQVSFCSSTVIYYLNIQVINPLSRPVYATPKVTKYQRRNFIIQIHKFTVKIDTISINLLFECVKNVESNFNSHLFLVMYQEILFVNQDACFLNQEERRQFLIISVSERG